MLRKRLGIANIDDSPTEFKTIDSLVNISAPVSALATGGNQHGQNEGGQSTAAVNPFSSPAAEDPASDGDEPSNVVSRAHL